MAGKKLAQVLAYIPLRQITTKQPLNSLRNFRGWATIPNGPPKTRVLAHGASQTEIIRILEASIRFYFFAFQPDVGNAVLATTIGATGNIELQLLVEAGQPFLQVVHQPACKRLGLSNSQFAEFAPGAGHGPAP